MNKLALGTVQFGLDYGILNTGGQVRPDEARRILKFAKESGIDTLDTASGYGDSEKVLGDIGVNDFQVVTKTVPLQSNVNNVLQSFNQSLKNLNTTSIDGLLIHNIDDIKDKQFDFLYKKLDQLKQDKLITKIGFSTYLPEQVTFLLENFDFDLIQVPFNVFDKRLIDSGQLRLLKNKNIEIHARSVFLQGILLNFEKLPNYFKTWKQSFQSYQEIVKESGLSKLEYALKYALSIEEIDKVLIGVDSLNQLKDVVIAEQKMIAVLPKEYSVQDNQLLNPGLWGQK